MSQIENRNAFTLLKRWFKYIIPATDQHLKQIKNNFNYENQVTFYLQNFNGNTNNR